MAQQKASAPEKEFEDFDRNNFDRSTTIDNPWFPMKPGMRWVLKGFTNEGGKRVPHRLVIIVTDLTKMIDGVRSVVLWMEDYSAGQLMERELAFFAQDKEGNVWAMGEHPEEYEDGKFAKAPTWIHGIEGSRAGIAMPAAPRLGAPSFSQGWAPAVNFTDRGVVDQVGQKTCVPLRCFEDVLVMAEGSKAEGADAQQLKYYARGVGKVRVGWRGKGETLQEVLELTEFSQLGPDALAKARAGALKLEKNAYQVSKEVYGRTSPVEHMPSAKGR
ncbi:MAG: hypothetical protein AUG80_11020 [Candidatus Rokubacteria bacterium 13_1_20CM_4_68_9]|nr:MAG: hypothetical protein AUG80_11020 [Candidatus Rokubacteria bacterium 13_1_20CM_4_68_9]